MAHTWSLERASAPALPLLDIGVVLFDPGVSDDDVSPLAAVRRLEGQLLAAELRDTLQQSNHWGVVRLVPSVSALTPIALQTRIVFSDGRDLILDVTARDAMGTLWFDQRIAHRSTLSQGLSGRLGRYLMSLATGCWPTGDHCRCLNANAFWMRRVDVCAKPGARGFFRHGGAHRGRLATAAITGRGRSDGSSRHPGAKPGVPLLRYRR